MEEVKQDTLAVGGLNPTPELYKSIPNNPSINRLRSLDIRLQVPFITEYLSGQITTESQTVQFNKTYKQIPLVVGIYDTEELGVVKVRPLLPNNQNMVVTKKDVTIGTATYPAKVGGKFRLRVYNLDLLP